MDNKEEIKRRIEIMQAWVDGKEVQFETASGWKDAGPDFWMEFNFYNIKYRIKPEPRVIFVNEYEDYDISHRDKDTALECSRQDCIHKAVKYIEVIE
jgi:hypothetical protein